MGYRAGAQAQHWLWDTEWLFSQNYSSWLLSEPLSYKIGRAQQQSTIKWGNGIFGIRPRQIQKTGNYINWWPWPLCQLCPLCHCSSLSCIHGLTGKFPRPNDRRAKLRPHFEHFLYFFFFFFFFFFFLNHPMWKFPGLGSHPPGPRHCSDNARSLTHWVTQVFPGYFILRYCCYFQVK